jgi:RHS repeat-associated protein
MAGLYLTRTRAYNPRTGRFLQRDKLDESGRNGIYRGFPFGSDAIGSNLYAWCRNNPTSMVDLSGHWGIRSLFGGIVRAARSFVRAAVNTFRRTVNFFLSAVSIAASYARRIVRRHRQAVARAATPIQQALRRVVTIVRKKITAQKFTGFSGQNGFGGKAGGSNNISRRSPVIDTRTSPYHDTTPVASTTYLPWVKKGIKWATGKLSHKLDINLCPTWPLDCLDPPESGCDNEYEQCGETKPWWKEITDPINEMLAKGWETVINPSFTN